METQTNQKRREYSNASNRRIRVSVDCNSPKMTDQSGKNSADINNIMDQYSKTGLLPVTTDRIAQYIDNTKIIPLEQAHALIRDAQNMFAELPAQIRKLMDNDPTNLVSFLEDPENREILEKHKVLKKKIVKITVESSKTVDSPSVDNSIQKTEEKK